MERQGNPWALLPIGVFLVLFIGFGAVTGDFYSMPAIVAFLIALIVAAVQNRSVSMEDKIKVIAQGAGSESIVIMCLVFLFAGAFSGAVKAAGGVESTVNLGLSILPPRFAAAGLFLIGCFISISMGTSMGTIAALAPIAVGISEKTGILLPISIGAVVCGAMFGDNLSMISDTTIAATRSQGCDMKEKFKENFLIVLPAAIVTIGIFLMLTWNYELKENENLQYSIWKVIPYFVVLIGALAGVDVFVVLVSGTALAVIIGVVTGQATLPMMMKSMGEGVGDMFEITVISILVAEIFSLVKANGGVDFLISKIRRRIHTERGAELGIAALTVVVDAATANNTVAIVMTGPIAKEMGEQYGILPKRTASLLDIFASVGQGLIPYGAQLLSAAQLTALTPFAILPYLWYPGLMAISALGFILLRRRKSADQ